MKEYQKNKTILVQLGLAPDQIFDFTQDGSPYTVLFEDMFAFSHANLTTQWKHYPLDDGLFYFHNSSEINAYADGSKKYPIIAINKGLVIQLYEYFLKTEPTLEEITGRLFNRLPGKLDVPLYFLLFQLTTMFTYYHELGHILQFTGGPSGFIQEKKELTKGNSFKQMHHAMEIDADLCAAHLMIAHVLQYFRKLPAEDQTTENLGHLLSTFSAGIFVFFTMLNKGITPLYFYENTHPHEVLRISYIVSALVDIAQINAPELGKLNGKTIMNDTFIATENLLQAGLDVSIWAFAEAFWNDRKNIRAYLDEMMNYIKPLPHLVRNHDKPFR